MASGLRLIPTVLPRIGLRARITIAFAVGALLMSALLAGATLGLTRQNLLDQRESSATARTYQNARTVAGQLPVGAAEGDPAAVLASLPSPSGSNPVLRVGGRWYTRAPTLSEDVLPAELRGMVLDGQPALMRFDHEGSTQLAVGVPIGSSDSAYFEIASLEELEDTLESIGISLLAAALLATVMGAAVGFWAARRVLRPL